MKRKILYAQFWKLERIDPFSSRPADPGNMHAYPIETMVLNRSHAPDQWAQTAREHLVKNGYYAFSLHLATRETGKSMRRLEETRVQNKVYANAREIRKMEIHLW